ncbi:MAG: hypothetical protein KTU85_05080 [Acidimicrobiia bacterium]|nr:hypothetical protein [Acidimicrobiia bacterium]MCY4457137.1 hypothetical protein [Acidimicrobiaceae bacterium]
MAFGDLSLVAASLSSARLAADVLRGEGAVAVFLFGSLVSAVSTQVREIQFLLESAAASDSDDLDEQTDRMRAF